MAIKPSLVPIKKEVKYVNISTDDKPKLLKLSKKLSPEVKAQYVRLLSEFFDVFVGIILI